MRFLIDADLPYSLVEVLSRHGHEAIHVRGVLGSATDEEVFDYAVDFIIQTKSHF